MARASGQKLKLLYLVRILTEETDEAHALSTQELINRLEEQGIRSERKSIYDDICCLQQFGYDILQRHSRQGGGYYMASRDFELAELKLLVDAVQSSKFITSKKSRELIGKLEKLASCHDAGKLRRQVHVVGRIKTENEGIYYCIDALHRAIQNNCQINFQYLEWNGQKQLVPRKGGRIYQVSPWALIWREENYYLLAWDESAAMMKHYRVDKMTAVEELSERRQGREQFQKLDLAVYADKTFGMFGGREETVLLEVPEHMTGVALDRFGREIMLRREREGYLRARVDVVVSGQFFGWLTGLGCQIRILGPQWVQDEYCNRLQEILNRYTVP
ncbi:MAG: WYL domain-containing protein [Acetatifactor sp.]|nr:WYL domain-containing protein [Acetatifactor sp.]